jgi:hypothetical protein
MSNLNLYRQVLDGRIKAGSAKKELDEKTPRLDEKIIVYPSQILNMLQMYLHNKINKEELSEWASFLILSDVCVCPDWEDDTKADKYEPMWYIIQQLSSPEIDGEITVEGVTQHVDALKAFKPSEQ